MFNLPCHFASRGKITKTLVVLISALIIPNRLVFIAGSQPYRLIISRPQTNHAKIISYGGSIMTYHALA